MSERGQIEDTAGRGSLSPDGRPPEWWRQRQSGRARPVLALVTAVVGVGALLTAGLAMHGTPSQSTGERIIDTQGLYHLTNIWTVHLKFTPEQWEAMEPNGGGFGRSGGPGGAPGGPMRQGPGGPGGPGGFSPAMFIAPLFLGQGDLNGDGAFSRSEFETLGRKWFSAWDTNKSGALDANKVRAGLNATLARVGPGPGPGGPGGPGMQMSLQGAEGKRNGVAAMAGIEFNYVHADLEFEGRTFPDVGVRYKGNGTFMESRNALKRSLKVDLNHYTQGRHLGGAAVLNLHSCVTDASFMNEVLAYQLYRDAGTPAPRTAYARLYLTVPGKHDRTFVGFYSLVENVDRHFVEENFGTKRGALFKPVTGSLFTYLGEDWARYRQTYDPKVALADDQKARMIELCRLVTEGTDDEFRARIGDYIDVPQLARFMAVMVFLSDMDGILGPGQNLYLYLHPRTQQITFLPWDQDHSWGQFAMRGTAEQRENLSIQKPWEGDNNRFLARVYKLAAFQKEYLAKLEEFSETIFQPERFHQQVDALAASIRPAVRAESEEKSARFDRAIAGETVGPGGFDPGFTPPGPTPSGGGGADDGRSGGPADVLLGPSGPGEQSRMRFGGPGGPFGFGQDVKPIKTFVPVRYKSIVDQLAGRSEGQTPGGFGGPGGPGGPRAGSGPGDFGPGMFLGPVFMNALDPDKRGEVTQEELLKTFARWYESWDTDKNGLLSGEELRAGIDQDLFRFGVGSPPGFGSPGFGPPGN